MNVTCKRCGKGTPKRFSMNNRVWGGRICGKCYREFGEVLENAKRRKFPKPSKTLGPPTPAPETKKTGLVARLFSRIFRRRGVQ